MGRGEWLKVCLWVGKLIPMLASTTKSININVNVITKSTVDAVGKLKTKNCCLAPDSLRSFGSNNPDTLPHIEPAHDPTALTRTMTSTASPIHFHRVVTFIARLAG